MTYNVFSGTLNPTQSINPEQVKEETWEGNGLPKLTWKSGR